MRVLVTGGAGFIGSTLVDRLLAEGHQVDVVDNLSTGSLANLGEARAGHRRAFSFHQLDIRGPELVPLMVRRRPEVVFHLAAQADVRRSVADPVEDAEVNVLGTLRVLEGAVACGASRVVYAASGGTLYGEPRAQDLPVRESHPRRPLTPLGVSTLAGLEYLRCWRELHDLEFCALALANVYGPRQDPHGEAGVVAIFAERLLAGEPLVIYGDGQQTRDFVYVDDVVDAFVRAVERGGGLLLHVGTGQEVSVLELARLLGKVAGVEPTLTFAPPRAGELRRNALDPGRAAVHLGWRPWTPLEEGLAAVLAWSAGRQRSGRKAASQGGDKVSGRDPRPEDGPPRRAPRKTGASRG
ncbi:NAD-dependent epimerase/dehydratase family protein [Aciditerrimonas ferrireducens]|uniref:NAD-dependent epimerase/dehydratase family protein n=1 Tax=Aciditerrimonas ferrireducens TaxID=667306 RepID=A0ABV6C2T5_9ACTN